MNDTHALETNLDGYGAPLIPWARVRDLLDAAPTQAPETGGPNRHTCWLTTIATDGRPRSRPIGAVAVGGRWFFTSGPGTAKSADLGRDDRVSLTFAVDPMDVVIEGTATRVTDQATLEQVVEVFAAGGWPAEVDGEAVTAPFSAPSAGPPPWWLYEVVAGRVYAFGAAEPHGATRFDLVPSTPDAHDAGDHDAGDHADETAIRALVHRWAAAVHDGDLAVVVADHTDDILMFDVPPPDDGIRGPEEYEAVWPEFFRYQASGATFDIVELQVTAGADVAWAAALLRCGTADDFRDNPDNRLRLTLGFRKSRGRWLIAHEHHSFPLR